MTGQAVGGGAKLPGTHAEWVRLKVDPLPDGEFKSALRDITVTELDLSWKWKGDENAALVVEYLTFNTSLTWLR